MSNLSSSLDAKIEKMYTAKFASAAAALEGSGMNWGVQRVPLVTAPRVGGVLASGLDLGGRSVPAYGVLRTDNGSVLGVVGERYREVSNNSACAWLDAYAAHGLKITGASTFGGGSRCSMFATIGDRPEVVTKGDFVALQLVVSWSHDGTSAVGADLRVLRLACLNGNMMATTSRLFKLRHTAGAAAPESSVIQGQVSEALAAFGETVGAYRNLAAKRADRAQVREYVRTVLDMEADTDLSTRGSKVLADIMGRYDDSSRIVADLLDSHRETVAIQRAGESSLLESILSGFDGAGIGQASAGSLQTGGTWWNAYNSVSEFLTHSAGRSAETREESLLFGEGRNRNASALRLAMAA